MEIFSNLFHSIRKNCSDIMGAVDTFQLESPNAANSEIAIKTKQLASGILNNLSSIEESEGIDIKTTQVYQDAKQLHNLLTNPKGALQENEKIFVSNLKTHTKALLGNLEQAKVHNDAPEALLSNFKEMSEERDRTSFYAKRDFVRTQKITGFLVMTLGIVFSFAFPLLAFSFFAAGSILIGLALIQEVVGNSPEVKVARTRRVIGGVFFIIGIPIIGALFWYSSYLNNRK